MALIDFNREPTRRELLWFGLILFAVLGVVGLLVYWKFQAPSVASKIWAVGGGLTAAYYAFRPVRRPLYFGWMYATFPIGWIISHTVLAFVFYLVLTPVGLIMRALGHDPMRSGFDREAESYWIKENPHRNLAGYFRQF